MKKLILYTVLFTCLLSVRAQLTCTQRLNQAEDDYEAGRLLDIPAALEGCLGVGFSKEEEVRARKLLTLVYIFTDQQSRAEEALINLLKAEPEHRLNPQVDPAELFFLYDQFRVAPIFRIGVKVGVNLTDIQVVQPYSTHNELFQNKFYNGKGGEFQNGQGVGFNVEATIERHLGQGLEAVTGFQWRLSEYNIDVVDFPDENLSPEPLQTALTHQQMYMRVPLLLRYNYGYTNRDQIFLPYAFLGAGYDLLLSSRYSNGDRDPGISYSTTDIDTSPITKKHGLSIIGGIGTKIRIKTHFLTVEAQYNNSVISYTDPSNVYALQESVFDLGFVEDELGINLFMFSVGWTQSIYSPKKLKVFRD